MPAMLALTLLMFQSLKRTQEPIQTLVSWAPLISRLLTHPNGSHNTNLVFSYIEAALPTIDIEEAVAVIRPELETPVQKEALMEIRNVHARARYHQAREEGLADGKAEGKAEGMAQGLVKGKRDALELILRRHFPQEAEAVRVRYADATAEVLDRLIERALVAGSIDEVFEG